MSGTKTHITGVRTVSVQVEDQDAALAFYVDILGFTKLRDHPTPGGGRWIELAPGDDNVIITLEPAPPGTSRGAIGIRFATEDAQTAHAPCETPGSTPTRSSAGQGCRPCAHSATPTETPSRSPNSHSRRAR